MMLCPVDAKKILGITTENPCQSSRQNSKMHSVGFQARRTVNGSAASLAVDF